MRAETVAVLVCVVIAACQASNVYMFLKIRVAQLESEKRVLDEVDQKYVRRESCYVPNCVPCAHKA